MYLSHSSGVNPAVCNLLYKRSVAAAIGNDYGQVRAKVQDDLSVFTCTHSLK